MEELVTTVKNVLVNLTSFPTVELTNDTHHLPNNTNEYGLSPLEERALVLYKHYGPQQCEAQALDLTDKVISYTDTAFVNVIHCFSFVVGIQLTDNDVLLCLPHRGFTNLCGVEKV